MDRYGLRMEKSAVTQSMETSSLTNFVMTDGLWRPQRQYFEHAHPWWEIVFYTGGEGTLLAGDRTIPFRPGTVVCTPPQTRHREEATLPFQNRWVAVRRLQAPDPFPVFQVPTDHPVFSLIALLYVESHLHRPHSQVIVRNLFDTFMIYLHEWLAAEPEEQFTIQLQRKITAGLPQPDFQVINAMAEIPMSRDHLRRLFKAQFGASPKQYLTDLRMSRARELLELGLSVKQTAEAVGLPDPYHFSRIFHKKQGVSPSQHQRQHQPPPPRQRTR